MGQFTPNIVRANIADFVYELFDKIDFFLNLGIESPKFQINWPQHYVLFNGQEIKVLIKEKNSIGELQFYVMASSPPTKLHLMDRLCMHMQEHRIEDPPSFHVAVRGFNKVRH